MDVNVAALRQMMICAPQAAESLSQEWDRWDLPTSRIASEVRAAAVCAVMLACHLRIRDAQ